MFDFLKRKIKISPEDPGINLARILESSWFTKIAQDASEYKNVSGITDEELNNLLRVLIMLHCTAISVGVALTGASELNKRIVLDAFWQTVSYILKEQVSDAEAEIFQANVAIWSPTLRTLLVDPSAAFPHEGSLGPGKVLFQLAMPNRDLNADMVDLVTRLTFKFVSISGERKQTLLLTVSTSPDSPHRRSLMNSAGFVGPRPTCSTRRLGYCSTSSTSHTPTLLQKNQGQT